MISGLIVNGIFEGEAVDIAGWIDDEVDWCVQGPVFEAEKFRVHFTVDQSGYGSMKLPRKCRFNFQPELCIEKRKFRFSYNVSVLKMIVIMLHDAVFQGVALFILMLQIQLNLN